MRLTGRSSPHPFLHDDRNEYTVGLNENKLAIDMEDFVHARHVQTETS